MFGKLAPWIVLFVLAGVLIGLNGISPFYFIDDAYISFRYAENLAEGHGLVFNPGERVEGYSTTTLVLLLALIHLFGVKIPIGALFVGLFFHAATVAMLLAFLRRFLTDKWYRPLPLFALLFTALHPTGVAYAESGMETSLASFLLLLTLYLAGAAVEKGRSAGLAAAAASGAFLLALTRPEMLALAAPIGLYLLLGNKEGRWPRAIAFGAVFAITYGSFLLWRHWYFGDWQPNTYYAKAAGVGWHMMPSGLRYFAVYLIGTLFPFALLALLALQGLLRTRMPGWWWCLLGVAAVQIGSVIWVGGDHFPLSRFFVPITPVLLLVLAQGWREARQALNRRFATMAQTSLIVAGYLSGGALLLASLVTAMFYHNDGITFIREGRMALSWCDLGKNLARLYPPDTSVGLIPIGAIGFCSKLPIVDFVGLTDREIARTPTDLTKSMPGHGRYNNRYVLKTKKPKLILVQIRQFSMPLPEWAIRKATHLATIELLRNKFFNADYAFHRLVLPNGYFHYWSRRDFEDPSVNPGTYPVEGVHCPLPAVEPVRINAAGVMGADAAGNKDFKVPKGWEVW